MSGAALIVKILGSWYKKALEDPHFHLHFMLDFSPEKYPHVRILIAGFAAIVFVVPASVLIYFAVTMQDLSTLAEAATEPSVAGQFAYVTGEVSSEDQKVGDDLFVKPDHYLAVRRNVEVYTEVRHHHSRGRPDTYTEEWAKGSSAAQPFGSNTFVTADGKVGDYAFNPLIIDFPPFAPLSLTAKNVVLSDGAVLANSNYLFYQEGWNGSFDAPVLGDVRIHYDVLQPGFTGTLFGQWNGSEIVPYMDSNGDSLYRIFVGSKEDAVTMLHSEYENSIWWTWFGVIAFGILALILFFVMGRSGKTKTL